MADGYDSVWLDFTKGLGAPLGAVLCGRRSSSTPPGAGSSGSAASMRQAGICAAACLYALDHNIDRLAEDHANARALARGLAQIPGMTVEEPETNLVFFDTRGTGLTAEALAERCGRKGWRSRRWGRGACGPARIWMWTAPRSNWRRLRCARRWRGCADRDADAE